MNVKTLYPMKIGDTLYPAGITVTVESPDHAYLQEHFPGLKFKAGSTYVAVTFPHWPHPTVVDRSQLDLPVLPREAFEGGAESVSPEMRALRADRKIHAVVGGPRLVVGSLPDTGGTGINFSK